MKPTMLLLEALLQLRVGDPLLGVECLVRLGEREHVRVDPGAEVLEGNPQRPEPAVAARHRRRGRQQQAVLLVERLRAEARHPVDRVLQHPGHRGVVFGRADHERVVGLDALAELVGAGRKAVLVLRVGVVGGSVEVATSAGSRPCRRWPRSWAARRARRPFSESALSEAEKTRKRTGSRSCGVRESVPATYSTLLLGSTALPKSVSCSGWPLRASGPLTRAQVAAQIAAAAEEAGLD